MVDISWTSIPGVLRLVFPSTTNFCWLHLCITFNFRKHYYVSWHTRKRNFMCRWNMNSLFISTTTTTVRYYTAAISTHCDCCSFGYCHNEWLNIRLKRPQCQTKKGTCNYMFIYFLSQWAECAVSCNRLSGAILVSFKRKFGSSISRVRCLFFTIEEKPASHNCVVQPFYLFFSVACEKNWTFYLPSILPPGNCNCTTSGTRTTVWERLV